MEELHFNADITGERIDKFLDGRIESLSRSYIQKLIKEKKILVNQLPVKANYKLTTGDTIILQIPDPEPLDIQPENIPLDILYEDDDILVVNKPKGMVVHPSAGHMSHTLVNGLLYHCKEYFLAQSRYGIVCLAYILFLMLLKSFLHLEKIRYIL